MKKQEDSMVEQYGVIKDHYEPPFYYCEHTRTVFDSKNRRCLEIRGWGRLQYIDNGADVQDSFGRFVAEALNERWVVTQFVIGVSEANEA